MTTHKHLTPEEEYFAREDLAHLKKMAEKKRRQMAKEEEEQLKKLHWMHCPKCGHELKGVFFRGVTIDKCFHCEGVFLDTGELEKLAGEGSHFFQSVLSLFKYD